MQQNERRITRDVLGLNVGALVEGHRCMQVQQELRDKVPPLEACKATSVGEFWFDDQMHKLLKNCGQPCAKIGILPLFQVIAWQHLQRNICIHVASVLLLEEGDCECSYT